MSNPFDRPLSEFLETDEYGIQQSPPPDDIFWLLQEGNSQRFYNEDIGPALGFSSTPPRRDPNSEELSQGRYWFIKGQISYIYDTLIRWKRDQPYQDPSKEFIYQRLNQILEIAREFIGDSVSQLWKDTPLDLNQRFPSKSYSEPLQRLEIEIQDACREISIYHSGQMAGFLGFSTHERGLLQDLSSSLWSFLLLIRSQLNPNKSF